MSWIKRIFQKKKTELDWRLDAHLEQMTFNQKMEDSRIESEIESRAMEMFNVWKNNQLFNNFDEHSKMFYQKIIWQRPFFGPYNISDMNVAKYLNKNINDLITIRYNELVSQNLHLAI